MTTTDPMRSKALACLREARVTVIGVKLDAVGRPVAVAARVRSSRDDHRYRVMLRAGVWSCDCRSGLRDEQCPHVRAVALVTTEEAA